MTAGGWLGRERVDLARCASTNDEAAARARAGAPHGLVVIAREQTAGRGRLGRSWHSPPGDNLYMSCLLRPALAPAAVPPLTLAAGIGVYDAVNSLGLQPSLKWPNDLLVHRAKAAGILTEMSSRDDHVEHVVLGIGVNLNGTELPPELRGRATTLALALGGRAVDPARFTEVLCGYLEKWLDRFFAGGVPAIASAWEERADLGRPVRVLGQGAPIEGRPRGLDRDGALRVEDPAGRIHRVVAGELEVLPF